MAKLEITYKNTIWFYISMFLPKRLVLKFFGNKIIAKPDVAKMKSLKVSDIIVIK